MASPEQSQSSSNHTAKSFVKKQDLNISVVTLREIYRTSPGGDYAIISVFSIFSEKPSKSCVETESTTAQEPKIDRRKTRTVAWREVRLCLAREKGSSQLTFGVTLGSVDAAVEQLAAIDIRAGLGSDTLVHRVGDGALWIANQVNRIFGIQAHYLIDFSDFSRDLFSLTRSLNF